MDKPTEDVATTQPINGQRTRSVTPHRRYGRTVTEAAVRTALVVVLDVAAENADKVLAAEDQQVGMTVRLLVVR